jgi:hypothetical protein
MTYIKNIKEIGMGVSNLVSQAKLEYDEALKVKQIAEKARLAQLQLGAKIGVKNLEQMDEFLKKIEYDFKIKGTLYKVKFDETLLGRIKESCLSSDFGKCGEGTVTVESVGDIITRYEALGIKSNRISKQFFEQIFKFLPCVD